jgi:hypothetical protein
MENFLTDVDLYRSGRTSLSIVVVGFCILYIVAKIYINEQRLT